MAKPPTTYVLGTVFNPHVVQKGYRVHYQYDDGCGFEVELQADGGLMVRMSGSHSDLIAIECHVANSVMLRARRWSNERMRYVEFVTEVEGKDG